MMKVDMIDQLETREGKMLIIKTPNSIIRVGETINARGNEYLVKSIKMATKPNSEYIALIVKQL